MATSLHLKRVRLSEAIVCCACCPQTILGVAGTLSFAVVEWKHYRHAPMKEPKLQEQSSK